MSSGPTIVQLTGPVLLGHFFNWGLYGCLLVQTYIYYLAFPWDKKVPKVLVSFVVMLETLQTVLATRDAFRDFGTGWGNMAELNEVGWLWFSVPVIGSLITSTSQLFFAWRIWILSRSFYIPVPLMLISTLQCIFGIWVGIRAHLVYDFSKVQKHSNSQTAVWLGSTALGDLIIAASMIFYLSRSRTGFRATNVLITKVLRITVETGLICAAFAVLDLAFFLRWNDNNYYLAPSIALSKLYSNSLLVVLNSRVRIVDGRGDSSETEFEMFNSFPSGTTTTSNTKTKSTTINILTINTRQRDDENVSVPETRSESAANSVDVFSQKKTDTSMSA